MGNQKTSKEGREQLKKHEAVIDGLYDDPSGYATYGVGHLVQKFKSLLLDTAQSEKLCESRVKTKWPGKSYAMPYLEREAVTCKDFDDLKKKAAERGPEIVAKAKYGKPLDELSDKHKAAARALAQGRVDEEVRLLNVSVDSMLVDDLSRFEKAVNSGVTGVKLTQGEFDALVSLAFNIGPANFLDSTLLKQINGNKYRSGDASQRKKAIDEIEKSFLAFDKSGGKQLTGLVKRRQEEAAAFLKLAKAELAALQAKAMGPPKPTTMSGGVRLP